MLFSAARPDGSDIGTIEDRVWLCTVKRNEQGGWTAECWDKVRIDDPVPPFVPKVPQPRPPKDDRFD